MSELLLPSVSLLLSADRPTAARKRCASMLLPLLPALALGAMLVVASAAAASAAAGEIYADAAA
jgi:hypothetical protein